MRWRTVKNSRETVTLARACNSSVYASNTPEKDRLEEEEGIKSQLRLCYICVVSSKAAEDFLEDN